jgi:hypothetical protein
MPMGRFPNAGGSKLKSVADSEVVASDTLAISNGVVVLGNGTSTASELAVEESGGTGIGTGTPVEMPVGFDWPAWAPQPTISVGSDGVYKVTNMKASDWDVNRKRTIYVDCRNGDDSYDGRMATWMGGTVGPKKTYTAAVGLIASWVTYPSVKFVLTPGVYVAPTVALYGGIGEGEAGGCSVVCENGLAIIAVDGKDGRDLVADTGTTYRTAANFAATMAVDFKDLDIYGAPREIKAVADAATCRTTPGSYVAVAASYTYINLRDGRKPDEFVMVGIKATAQYPLYSEGPLFAKNLRLCGNAPLRLNGPTLPHTKYIFKNCGFYFSEGSYNGCDIKSNDAFHYFEDCQCAWNKYDGFNYHSMGVGDPNGYKDACFLEVGSVGVNNGGIGGTAMNGSTCHDGYVGIRVGGIHVMNGHRNVHDIAGNACATGNNHGLSNAVPGGSQTWNLGVTAGNPTQAAASSSSFSIGANATTDNCKMWLDGCKTIIGGLQVYDLESSLHPIGFYYKRMDITNWSEGGPGPTAY